MDIRNGNKLCIRYENNRNLPFVVYTHPLISWVTYILSKRNADRLQHAAYLEKYKMAIGKRLYHHQGVIQTKITDGGNHNAGIQVWIG